MPESIRWLEGRCYAHTQTTSYAPFIQILRAAFQLESAHPSVVARTKLRAALQTLVGEHHDQVYPVIAHLLDIDLEPGQPNVRSLDPRALQSQLVAAMRTLMESLLARTPLILAFEDIHWADAASIELLTVLMELTDFLPLMILVVCRPDFEGGSWELRFHAQRNYPHRLSEIQLNPLTPEQAELLTRNLLQASRLPKDLQLWVLERSEGNPLFLEEIIRTLIEEKAIRREKDKWVVQEKVDRLVIPNVLRGVIAARIDRLLATAKVVLQHASVVGRFFTYSALQVLAGDEENLDGSVAYLLRVGLVREWERLPELEYLFKHVLTQEAAYASILDEERRTLHRRVAIHLEQRSGDLSDENAAVLAYHWLGAEDREKAIEYILKAAGRARNLYARVEAVAHYWQALELLEDLPRTIEQDRIHMNVVLSLVKLPGCFRDSAERVKGLRHIDEAIQTADDNSDVATVAQLEAMKGFFLWDGNLLKQAVAHSEASRELDARALAAEMYGHYLGANGHFVKALAYFEHLIDITASEGAKYEQAWYMASGGRCYSARAGKLDKALEYAAGAREIEESINNARLRAWCGMEAEPCMYKGLWDQLVRVAEEGQTAAWEIGEWGVIFWLAGWLGIAHLKLGHLEDARRVIDRALEESQARSFGPFPITYLQITAAQLHLALGEPDKALEAVRKALQMAESNRLRLEQGAANRVLGQVHEAMESREEADTAFRLSLQILGEIQSRPELAQTLLAYGHFKAVSDPAGGRTLVEQALSLFEEMGATGWINEARAALDS